MPDPISTSPVTPVTSAPTRPTPQPGPAPAAAQAAPGGGPAPSTLEVSEQAGWNPAETAGMKPLAAKAAPAGTAAPDDFAIGPEVQAVSKATAKIDQGTRDKAALDKEFQAALKAYGPGLTGEEREAYRQTFYSSDKARQVDASIKQGTSELESAVKGHEQEFADYVAKSQATGWAVATDRADVLMAGMAALAKDHDSPAVKAFVLALTPQSDQLSPQAQKAFTETILAPAMEKMAVKEGEAATKGFLQQVSETAPKVKDIHERLESVQTLFTAAFDAKTPEELEQVCKVSGAVGKFAGIAALALAPVRLQGALDEGNYGQLAQELLNDASATVGMADALIGDTAAVMGTTGDLVGAAFLEFGGPVLGAISGAIGVASNAHDANWGGAIASGLGVVSAVAFLVPGAQPLALVLGAASLGLGLLYEGTGDPQPSDEAQRALRESQPEQLASAMLGASPKRLRQLQTGWGLSPLEVQQVLLGPNAGLAHQNSTAFDQLNGIFKLGDKVDGTAAIRFLNAMPADTHVRVQELQGAYQAMEVLRARLSPAEARDKPAGWWSEQLTALQQDPDFQNRVLAGNPEYGAGITALAAQLAAADAPY